MTWVEKNPHPGPRPPLPPEGKPANDAEDIEWSKMRAAYNDWVRKMRRHMVARSVEKLGEKPSADMTPVEEIAFVVGVCMLDGSIATSGDNLFSALFGGLI
jgi:hypothetical protein